MDLTHREVLCLFHAMNKFIPLASKKDRKVIDRVYAKLGQAYADTLPSKEKKKIEDALKSIGVGRDRVFVGPGDPNPKGKPIIKLRPSSK